MTNECECGRPTAGAVLCETCVKTMSWSLVNVGIYFLDLATVQRKQTRYGSSAATKGSIGKSQPLPVDTRFAGTTAPGNQLRWDTWNTVVAWARTVMTERGPAPIGPAHVACLHLSCNQVRSWPAWPTSNTVTGMLEYLARNRRHITSQAWAPQLLDELTYLEHRLARMVDRPADRWYAGRCGVGDEHATCETELYARTDRGFIDCPGCGIRHDVAERREFLLAEAKEYLVTATEAAVALLAWTDYDGSETKVVDRIRKWRDRDRLEVRDVTSLNGRDRHLYRLGDIQELLVGDAQERQTSRLAAG